MIISNSTLSSYNMQQKVDIIHSIRIETSYIQLSAEIIMGGRLGKISNDL
jgi:hypothetical protein